MSLYYGGAGVTQGLGGLASNQISLLAGQVQLIPAGWWFIKAGLYTTIQEYDPIAQFWRSIGGGGLDATAKYVHSDGVNFRLANQTGSVVGALITNAGTGYTSAPTVTASAGGSLWRAVVGGALSTTVTVTNGGVGYSYPPAVQIAAPPPGGVQATGYCTLTSGVVSSVTITNQGAGYAQAPQIVFTNDPREGLNGVTQGYNAAATATLTGAGTITALLCIDHGTGIQTTVPTLSFAGGGGASAAATSIMCWTVTSFTVTTAGVALSGATAWITGEELFPATAPAYTNPATQSGLVRTRKADIKGTITAAALVVTTQVVNDGGIYTAAPTPYVITTTSVATTAPAVALVMGGANDTATLFPA